MNARDVLPIITFCLLVLVWIKWFSWKLWQISLFVIYSRTVQRVSRSVSSSLACRMTFDFVCWRTVVPACFFYFFSVCLFIASPNFCIFNLFLGWNRTYSNLLELSYIRERIETEVACQSSAATITWSAISLWRLSSATAAWVTDVGRHPHWYLVDAVLRPRERDSLQIPKDYTLVLQSQLQFTCMLSWLRKEPFISWLTNSPLNSRQRWQRVKLAVDKFAICFDERKELVRIIVWTLEQEWTILIIT